MTIEINNIASSNSIDDFIAKKINKMPISTAIEFLEKAKKTIVVIKNINDNSQEETLQIKTLVIDKIQIFIYLLKSIKQFKKAIDNFYSNNKKEFEQIGNTIEKRTYDKHVAEKMSIFLEYAKDDLISYHILFKKGQYANAIFHLQQSAEKALKSLSYAVLEYNAKDASHNPVNIIKELSNKYTFISKMPKLSEFVQLENKLLKDMKSMQKKLKTAIKNIKPEQKIPLEIVKMFSDFSFLNDDIYNNTKNFISIITTFSYLEFLKTKAHDIYAKNGLNFMILFFFAALLLPHETQTRYPKEFTDKLVPYDYTDNNYIVKMSKDISKRIKEEINWIDKMINESKSKANNDDI
ncbi:MAG: HEPN domain-containing protein [bacterium]